MYNLGRTYHQSDSLIETRLLRHAYPINVIICLDWIRNKGNIIIASNKLEARSQGYEDISE